MENKYKSLGSSIVQLGSVLFIRLTAGFVSLIGAWLLVLYVTRGEKLIVIISLAMGMAPLLYSFHLFSSLIYSSTEIMIQNIYGKKVFKKADFITVRPWVPYFNLYVIEFTGGQNFIFGIGQLAPGIEDNNKTAAYLTKKLLNE